MIPLPLLWAALWLLASLIGACIVLAPALYRRGRDDSEDDGND